MTYDRNFEFEGEPGFSRLAQPQKPPIVDETHQFANFGFSREDHKIFGLLASTVTSGASSTRPRLRALSQLIEVPLMMYAVHIDAEAIRSIEAE